jgi:hypothetical protein
MLDKQTFITSKRKLCWNHPLQGYLNHRPLRAVEKRWRCAPSESFNSTFNIILIFSGLWPIQQVHKLNIYS